MLNNIYLRPKVKGLPEKAEISQVSERFGLFTDIQATKEIAMNFGIVRNNIYRISIESISVMRGTLKLMLEEEKWRHVDNPIIYI